MNAIWRKLTGTGSEKKNKRQTYTLAFNGSGFCIGSAPGIKEVKDFDGATVVNVIHKNGKITIKS